MHLLGINQWLFIGYFVGRWINFICMSEKAWIFLPLHMGSGGDANVRKSFLASWVRRASPDRLGVSRVSFSRDDMMRRLSKMWFSARITCAHLWEWYTIDASLRGIIHQSVTLRRAWGNLVSLHSLFFTHLSCLRMLFQSISLVCLVLFCKNVASIFFCDVNSNGLLFAVNALWSYHV